MSFTSNVIFLKIVVVFAHGMKAFKKKERKEDKKTPLILHPSIARLSTPAFQPIGQPTIILRN